MQDSLVKKTFYDFGYPVDHRWRKYGPGIVSLPKSLRDQRFTQEVTKEPETIPKTLLVSLPTVKIRVKH
ncbi:hypothetical protein AMECASPLE_033453 [Ameca splendens]|uniref:Uncharacterized protein n=1 Tax=Ameca splendens TaxID=208324 RepID=A0ABV0XJS3_9TELE